MVGVPKKEKAGPEETIFDQKKRNPNGVEEEDAQVDEQTLK